VVASEADGPWLAERRTAMRRYRKARGRSWTGPGAARAAAGPIARDPDIVHAHRGCPPGSKSRDPTRRPGRIAPAVRSRVTLISWSCGTSAEPSIRKATAARQEREHGVVGYREHARRHGAGPRAMRPLPGAWACLSARARGAGEPTGFWAVRSSTAARSPAIEGRGPARGKEGGMRS